ncbi:unnamed protein product [Didymodactylos carnosus]|uniref:Reverse transcriptase/retrotransposon-derived protein RNase H-like domain-containing protein n=1 Tax=Didymodactylos carnosus TaxID=1234261 RepID=A0A815M0F7_9BILA|nr:unnamed protein product [Didymodactylos carnosus]CAF1412791.1 unnamed protein product [Didymodactylos carnosus]CAF4040955.1 unnamed protein product [Didymodactylos carnosus]CAF4300442.1 unnamed protein product [Didymodactylos carnosus]
MRWDTEEQQAFDVLKNALTTATILAQPDYTRPFKLYTDASNVGIGAILQQCQEPDNVERVICFLSRQLTSAEKNYKNYGITELECLAVVWSLTKLHCLDGVPFELITDHSASQAMFDFKGSNKRLLNWSLDVQPYREFMTIIHRPGRKHTNIDPLSRNLIECINNISVVSLSSDLKKEFISSYSFDPYFSNITDILQNPQSQQSDHNIRQKLKNFLMHDQLLYFVDPGTKNLWLYVPNRPELKSVIFHDSHDAPVAGHLGYTKTYFDQTIVLLAENVKRSLPKTASGHTLIIVFVDRLTKRVYFRPTMATVTAADTAKIFFNTIFVDHGLPDVLISDRDSKFTSNFWKSIFTWDENHHHFIDDVKRDWQK